MNASTTACARCGTPTASHELTMSLQGDGYVCQTCNLAARDVQQKAGTKKAYLTGALIVGVAILVIGGRILVRILLAN